MAEVAERSTVEILRAARERITPVERWTTGVEARDAADHLVDADDPAAVKWCMAGAVYAEGGDATSSPSYGVTPMGRLLNRAIGSTGAGPWNDSHTHEEVLAALDRAIQLAEQEATNA